MVTLALKQLYIRKDTNSLQALPYYPKKISALSLNNNQLIGCFVHNYSNSKICYSALIIIHFIKKQALAELTEE